MDQQRIKHCGCGRSFTRSEWDALERLPNWQVDPREVAEVRNCACGRTLSFDTAALSLEVTARLATRSCEPLDDRGRRLRGIISRVACSPVARVVVQRVLATTRAPNDAITTRWGIGAGSTRESDAHR